MRVLEDPILKLQLLELCNICRLKIRRPASVEWIVNWGCLRNTHTHRQPKEIGVDEGHWHMGPPLNVRLLVVASKF